MRNVSKVLVFVWPQFTHFVCEATALKLTTKNNSDINFLNISVLAKKQTLSKL